MKVEITDKEEKSQIDWSKPMLVMANDGDLVLYDERINTDEDFSGLRLNDGCYSNNWCIALFKPFTGKITLSND